MIKSMTTGHPLSLMILFSIPVLLGNLFQQFYILSDIYIVGHYLGVYALSVIGISASIFVMCLFLANGFTQGLAIITAQRFGAQDIQGVKRSFAIGICLSLMISLILMFFLWIGLDVILELTNTPNEILANVKSFLIVTALLMPGMIFYNFFSAVLRALGDSKTPLLFLIFASVLNIILNCTFIVIFKFGVVACAYGTGIAQAVSALFCLTYMLKRFEILRVSKSDWRIQYNFLKQHLKIACVMGLQFSIIGWGVIIMQTVCNTFGSETIAAFTAGTRLEQFMGMPVFALGMGVTNYIAQNYGAGLFNRIKQGVLQAFCFVMGLSAFLFILMYFIGSYLILFFLDNPTQEVYQQAQLVLMIGASSWSFLGLILVFRQAIQGMGNAFLPFAACVIELLMRWFSSLYLTKQFGFIGLCFATPSARVVGGIWCVICYFYLMKKSIAYNVKKNEALL